MTDVHWAVTFVKARVSPRSSCLSCSLQLPTTKYNTVLFSYLFLSQCVLNLNWLPTFKSLQVSHFKIKQNITGFLASGFCWRIRKFNNTEPRSFCGSNELFWSRAASRRRQWHATPVLLPRKSHGWRSLVGCSSWSRYKSDMTEWLHFHFSLSHNGEVNGNPLQCSCLENPRDGKAWRAAVYGIVDGHLVAEHWIFITQAAWEFEMKVKLISRQTES